MRHDVAAAVADKIRVIGNGYFLALGVIQAAPVRVPSDGFRPVDDSGKVNEMTWIFDVEDEMDFANDLAVPAEGIRVPLTRSFRWIKNISFGQEYHEGSKAVRTVYVDKGIIVDGQVVEGPMIYCRDAENNSVAGIVDVTMQGAKGV